MKKDKIDQLFKNTQGDFDVKELPFGHQQRFLNKLQASTQSVRRKDEDNSKSGTWKMVFRVAAIFAIVFVAGNFLWSIQIQQDPTGLASVSPKMAQTESFFISAINKELQTLKEEETAETKKIVEDALFQIKQLESDYAKLEQDLLLNNNDKRIVFAMISNLQNRIDLLQEVLQTLSDIKKINKHSYETI